MALTLPESTSPALARAVEDASLLAWPGAREIKLDGWLLRFNGGYTDRANSVQPLDDGEMPLKTKLVWCMGAFSDAGLPAQFRITSLTDQADALEKELASLGFKKHSPTCVLYLDALPEAEATLEGWRIMTEQSTEWLTHFRRMDATSPEHFQTQEELLGRLPAPHGFGLLERDGQVAACGQVVVTGDYAGVFDIVTDEALRRQGLGQALVESLMQWAREQGARHAYLQVEAANQPARKLYEKLGFRHLYDYHYWRSS